MAESACSPLGQNCVIPLSKHEVLWQSTGSSSYSMYTPTSSHAMTNSMVPTTFVQSQSYHSPCLPVSKGSIKKPAETRFVNSSPRSYRLMPASVESSDTTSFVEKSSIPKQTPMKVMLDVAELWKLSKRSELECNFTLATGKSKLPLDADHYIKETIRRSPICHPAILPSHVSKKKHRQWATSGRPENMALGRKLFAFVKIFFGAKELTDGDPIGAAELLKKELDSGVLLTLNFLREMHGQCTKMNWMSVERSTPASFSLAPLVKRLSVSGLGDEEDFKAKDAENNHEWKEYISKPQASIKRPISSHATDCDEAPVNKRAFCHDMLTQHSIHPG